ncbi:hypothetical protein TNCV_908021 [Trichonephila clavipes]|nr:hypothetical protein TNCV_908021 [Trichonephila clavipes]
MPPFARLLPNSTHLDSDAHASLTLPEPYQSNLPIGTCIESNLADGHWSFLPESIPKQITASISKSAVGILRSESVTTEKLMDLLHVPQQKVVEESLSEDVDV